MRALEWNLEQHRREVDAKFNKILTLVEQLEQQRGTIAEISTQAPMSSQLSNKLSEIGSSLTIVENTLREMNVEEKFTKIDTSLRSFENVLDGMKVKVNGILNTQESRGFNESIVAKVESCASGLGESMDAFKVLERNFDIREQKLEAKLNKVLTFVEQFDLRIDDSSTQATRLVDNCCRQPRNCADIQGMQGERRSGIYTIYPMPSVGVSTICDLSTDGGGWTVFQVRGADVPEGQNRTDFFRNWVDYENGFGSVRQDYWLGLRTLSALCELGDCELRVELMDWSGNRRYANYKTFTISGVEDGYRATFSGYVGDAGNALAFQSGMKFSTFDVDNDLHTLNCARDREGAWWYKNCLDANLNGVYYRLETNGVSLFQGLIWHHWPGYEYSMKMTQMKVRGRTKIQSQNSPRLKNCPNKVRSLSSI